MLKRIIKLKLIILLILVIVPLGAKDKNFKRDYGFGPLEIFQFKKNTNRLQIHDINSDGLDDILFLNNSLSRLEILIRKTKKAKTKQLPELKESFYNKGITLDRWVKMYEIADLNKDKCPDIIALNDMGELQIFYQKKNNNFSDPVTIEIKDNQNVKNIDLEDFNGDNNIDIIVCRKENAEIFWNREGKFSQSQLIKLSAYDCLGVIVLDINGDNLPDLLFYFPKEKLSLRVLIARKEGGFEWETGFDLPDIRFLNKIASKNKKTKLAAIMHNAMIMRLFEFQRKNIGSIFNQQKVISKFLPVQGVDNKINPSWSVIDFNRDGYSDLIISAPRLSQVHLYKGSKNGFSSTPVKIDTLTSVKSLLVTKERDLVVFSAEENAIAFHGKNKLFKFPEFLKAKGKPVAITTDGFSNIYSVYSAKGYFLNVFNLKKGNQPFKNYKLDIEQQPEDIKVFPLKAGSESIVMLFMPYDKPQVFHVKNNKFKKLTIEQFKATGLVLKATSVYADNFSKNRELVVCEGKVARIYKWQNNKFFVKRQLNPIQESAVISAANSYNIKNQPGHILYDDSLNNIYWFSMHKKKNKTNIKKIHLMSDITNLLGIAPVSFKNKNGILLISKSRIQFLKEDSIVYYLRKIGEYTSKAEKPQLWKFISLKLGIKKQQKLAILDAHNHAIEIIGIQNGKLTGELVFEVFKDSGFGDYRKKNVYEPHDIASGDINGDDLTDIAVLVHDKLLIYLSE